MLTIIDEEASRILDTISLLFAIRYLSIRSSFLQFYTVVVGKLVEESGAYSEISFTYTPR